jgi:membrane protein DedA with SNARE-associated domain
MHHLGELIAHYGYWIVPVLVGLEGAGVPAPGETALISAAIWAGKSHYLDIRLVILSAAGGAVVGDNLGFWLGRRLGTKLLLRYGRHVGLDHARLKLGHYLFMRYGGALAAFGRFVPVLRTLVPFVAGANRMPWRRFVAFNACGATAWAVLDGMAAYLLGHEIARFGPPVAITLIVLAVLVLAFGLFQVRRHQARLQAEAERALPGPLV